LVINYKCYHESIKSKITITGHSDRASVTSTTSKKPGDLQEESEDGRVVKVFEVTLKPFDDDRIRDSYDAIYKFAGATNGIKEVIVICRLSDCPERYRVNSRIKCLGETVYNGIKYIYYDINEWIFNQILRMDSVAKKMFFQEFSSYVSNPNTSLKVKEKWIEYNELGEEGFDPDLNYV
jgi:hypothetical protein